MIPECTSAWRNYEVTVNVVGYERRTQDAFEAGWRAATEAATSATIPQGTPSVGHVYEGSPTGRKSSLCWICGKPLPHDCIADITRVHNAVESGRSVYGIQPRDAVDAHVQRGELLNAIHRELTNQATHGPPQKQRTAADFMCLECKQLSPDYYMINDELWESVVPDKVGMLHLVCLEARLRRPVALSDFSQYAGAPINRLLIFGLSKSSTHGPPQKVELGPLPTTQSTTERLLELYAERLYNWDAALAKGSVNVEPEANQALIDECVALRDSMQVGSSEDAKRLSSATKRKWPIGTALTSSLYVDAMTWGARLAAARTHAGITLDALGSKLDPPRTRKDISAMEHGRRGLSVELCAQLADALDCDRLWLAGWTLEGVS